MSLSLYCEKKRKHKKNYKSRLEAVTTPDIG
jgi:hypothetical protein